MFGRGMDRYGRRPGLAVAYLVLGSAGVVCGIGVAVGSFALLLAGTLVFGAAFGGTNLARAAVADMYAPERRGKAVGLVLAAGTVGAIASPFLVAYLRSWAEGEGLNPDVVPWVLVPTAAIGAFACALSLRPDPRDLSAGVEGAAAEGPSRRPRELLAVPRIRMAVLAVAVGQMAMVAVMGITPIALDHHHASTAVVSTVISLHVAGMWAFAPVIGAALDRYGRTPGLLIGGITSVVGAVLCATDRPEVIAVGLFAIGLGWSATYLGATAVISDLTEPSERAGALGFSDLVVSASSAVAGFVSGVVFDVAGFRVLGIGVAALVLVAILSVARRRGPVAVGAEPGS
jgi:MFS family permease